MKKSMKSIGLLGLAMLLISAGISYEQYLSTQQDINRLNNDNLHLVEAAKAASVRISQLNSEKTAFKEELVEAQNLLAPQNFVILKIQLIAEEKQLTPVNVAQNLEPFKGKFSEVTSDAGKVKLVMDQVTLFAKDGSQINFEGDTSLDRFVATLTKLDDVEIAMEDYTNITSIKGSENSGDLSIDKSIAVMEILTNKYHDNLINEWLPERANMIRWCRTKPNRKWLKREG